jgi:hypothetical protein
MVRTGPEDPGTVTEFKTLKRPSPNAVSKRLEDAVDQNLPHGNGHVVIDGRAAGLTETAARAGQADYVRRRQKDGKPLADQVTIILADGRGISWRADD